jgi:hypothetical protein
MVPAISTTRVQTKAEAHRVIAVAMAAPVVQRRSAGACGEAFKRGGNRPGQCWGDHGRPPRLWQAD